MPPWPSWPRISNLPRRAMSPPSFEGGAEQSQLLHLDPERVAADAEDARRRHLVALGLPEHDLEQEALYLVGHLAMDVGAPPVDLLAEEAVGPGPAQGKR